MASEVHNTTTVQNSVVKDQQRGTRLLITIMAVFCATTIVRGLWLNFGPPSYRPRIQCVSPTFDFGVGASGERLSHEFRIHNAGKRDLVISNVSSNCGCVAAIRADGKIPPGHSIMLPVRVVLNQVQDQMAQTLIVHTNDPIEPSFVLQVTGRVVAKSDAGQPSGQ